jgi:hypothetical protein
MLRTHFEYLHTLHDSTIALFYVLRKKTRRLRHLIGSTLPDKPQRKCFGILAG